MKYVRLTFEESSKLVNFYENIGFFSSLEEIEYFNEKFGLKYAAVQKNKELTFDCYYEIIDKKKFTFACIEYGICPELMDSLYQNEN